ncbi:MAG: hypothetical protein ABL949_08735 [Fimbriimonadaceae bacterium]
MAVTLAKDDRQSCYEMNNERKRYGLLLIFRFFATLVFIGCIKVAWDVYIVVESWNAGYYDKWGYASIITTPFPFGIGLEALLTLCLYGLTRVLKQAYRREVDQSTDYD